MQTSRGSKVFTCKCTHTHTHTHTDAQIHTHAPTYIHEYAYIHTNKPLRISTCTHTHLHWHEPTHTHIYTHTYIQIHTYKYIHTNAYIQIHTYKYIHTNTYTQIHAYKYIHTITTFFVANRAHTSANIGWDAHVRRVEVASQHLRPRGPFDFETFGIKTPKSQNQSGIEDCKKGRKAKKKIALHLPRRGCRKTDSIPPSWWGKMP